LCRRTPAASQVQLGHLADAVIGVAEFSNEMLCGGATTQHFIAPIRNSRFLGFLEQRLGVDKQIVR
jgi:hypothetical protein